MSDTKKCSRCGKKKQIADFGEYKQCSSCLDYCRDYSKNHAEQRRNWAKENAEKTKEEKQTKIYCDDCNLEIQKGSWAKHVQSKNHLINIGKDDREFFEKTKWMTCPICNDFPIQNIKYKRHTQTTKHQENLKKQQT